MVHCGSHCENRDVAVSSQKTEPDSARTHLMALVAVECESPGVPPRPTLDRQMASVLADALAHDLAAQIPQIALLDFVFAGALYDQAQLLRPQWPLHAALADSLERLPRQSSDGHVVALGTHEGRLPTSVLEPEDALYGSPMLVMPWLLSGPTEIIAEVAQRLERDLMERGLIGAELALAIGEAFEVKTAHARHMTTLDLCSLACAQYEHAGLGGIWQIIETALLRPDQEQAVTLDDGSSLKYRNSTVHFEPHESRMLAPCRAILGAHGIVVVAIGNGGIDA